MPEVIIIKPNNTPQQEQEALMNITNVLERIILKEYGIKVKVELEKVVN